MWGFMKLPKFRNGGRCNGIEPPSPRLTVRRPTARPPLPTDRGSEAGENRDTPSHLEALVVYVQAQEVVESTREHVNTRRELARRLLLAAEVTWCSRGVTHPSPWVSRSSRREATTSGVLPSAVFVAASTSPHLVTRGISGTSLAAPLISSFHLSLSLGSGELSPRPIVGVVFRQLPLGHLLGVLTFI